MTELSARFPFSAVVGQGLLKQALILTAITPEIGGVLIRGERGTAKTTIVRALGAILAAVDNGGAVVELPIGATEDRVIGSVDVETMLHSGRTHFTPGVLADANGGVLYIDEVNLLADHLVDVLLDAATSGEVIVERDGISHRYDARFVLVGTMNPEEGELRPQLLDRFGLSVEVNAPDDVDQRVEIVRRRMAFDADPAGFAGAYAEADAQVAGRIAQARMLVNAVSISRPNMRRIAAVCSSLGVDGLRGDIVVARAARAHAAWRGSAEVDEADVGVAVELALGHRRRRDAFDDNGISQDDLESALAAGERAANQAPTDPHDDPPPGGGAGAPGDGDMGDRGPQLPVSCAADTAAEPDSSASAPSGSVTLPTQTSASVKILRANGIGDGMPGRRSAARARRGRVVRADSDGCGLHLLATARNAALRTGRERLPLPIQMQRPDLMPAIRHATEANLVVFLVDLSGSMAARARLEAVSQACVALLGDSYRRRDEVAVVAMRGQGATVLVPPTRSVEIAVRRIDGAPTGGRTPLAEGIEAAWGLISCAARQEPQRRAVLVILTDGRATSGTHASARAMAAARKLRLRHRDTTVIDCESGHIRLGLAVDLAVALGAPVLSLDEFVSRASGWPRPRYGVA